MNRVPHSYQNEARKRILAARQLLAEASGLLRACDRDFGPAELGAGLLRPGEAAREVEDTVSQLRLIDSYIANAPAGQAI